MDGTQPRVMSATLDALTGQEYFETHLEHTHPVRYSSHMNQKVIHDSLEVASVRNVSQSHQFSLRGGRD